MVYPTLWRNSAPSLWEDMFARRDFERLFNRYADSGESLSAWAPMVDVKETADEITVHAELPGLNPEDVNVTVQNGGVNKESDVQVLLSVAGAGKPIVREQTIPNMDAGQQKIVSIPLAATPPTGRRLSVHVEIKPVPGETKTDNNKATYGVIFTH